jgi:flagellin-like protein
MKHSNTSRRGTAGSDEGGDRAVSPVVGVAILVGITVILASVVGAFVFGLVDIGESPPDASFTFDRQTGAYSADPGPNDLISTRDNRMIVVRTLHNSGEAIATDQLIVKVSGNQSEPQSNESVYSIDYNGDGNDDDWEDVWNASRAGTSEFVSPGDSQRIIFYGVSAAAADTHQIEDYNVSTREAAGNGQNPPTPLIGLGGEDTQPGPRGNKLGNCDIIEIVWQSPAGDRGQVLQSYRLPGETCT